MGGLSTESATREAVKAALAAFERPASLTVEQIDLALAELAEQSPLKSAEPGLDGQMSRLLEDTLRPIGAALDPRLAPEQAKVWRKALVLKLSNLPGAIVVKAARKAVHDSFNFFNEVEPRIRELSEQAAKQQRTAAMRLERWRGELERAANPPPVLEAPPITQEEVDRMNKTMRQIRSKQRWRLENGEAVLVELEKPEEPEEPTENSPV